MTGEQLNQYIERIRESLDSLESAHPELVESLKMKRVQLDLLAYFSKDARENYLNTDIPTDQEAYAKTAIETLVMNNAGHPKSYISYAPMYMEIAKYSLSISRVCDILGISANIRSLISKNKPVHGSVLKKISDFLECGVDDLIETIDHDEHIRRLTKHSIFKTSSKNNEYTDLVKILEEALGKQHDTSEENSPKMARRDSNYPPGSGKAIKKIFDEMLESMDEQQRKLLRANIAHNTGAVSNEFVSSVLGYKDFEQLEFGYGESED
nr:MAG TPA: Cro/C1-type HTH DNA-binding domain protein [Caudoviricetes sp.]